MYNPDTFTLKTRDQHFAHPHHIEEGECPFLFTHKRTIQSVVWAASDRNHDALLALEKGETIEVLVATLDEADPLPERVARFASDLKKYMINWRDHINHYHLKTRGKFPADLRPIDTIEVTFEPVSSPTSGRSGVKLVFTQSSKPHRRRWYRQWLKTAIL